MRHLFATILACAVSQAVSASGAATPIAEDRASLCLQASDDREQGPTDSRRTVPDERRMRQIACAVDKALVVAVERGFRAERSMIVVEPSADRETARVEIASPTFRGGGVCVEVRLENCEVVDIAHLQ